MVTRLDHEAASSSASPSPRPARLVLEDGLEFAGSAFGSQQSSSGEVVFTTGMVGYPESLTDPSYRGQFLVMTYPLVGNYGVRAAAEHGELPVGFEADRIHAQGLVVSALSSDESHWQASRSLHRWLADQGIVGISGIDTRRLTQRLREGGSVSGKILVDGADSADGTDEMSAFPNIGVRNLVAEVSCSEPIRYAKDTVSADGWFSPDGKPPVRGDVGQKRRVVLVDCGAKANIVRSLTSRGAEVLRVPWDYDLSKADGDGILISNGPGDPAMAADTVEQIRRAIAANDRPVFGICLGNQLLGRAIGGTTYKLKFGHRGQNQPCREVGTQRCYITSQNHGYALDTTSLPDEWEESFVNANDGTNEGIRHESGRFQTVQFHPEANPGPKDCAFLFDRFLEALG